MIIGITAALAGLDDGILDGGPLTPIAEAGIGVAVPSGVEIPEIGSVENLTGALTAARSVAYAPSSPSGIYLAKLLQGRHLRTDQWTRYCHRSGLHRRALLDGRAAIAFQQMSKLRFSPGAKIAGPLPPDVQQYTAFSAGIAAQTKTGRQLSERMENRG